MRRQPLLRAAQASFVSAVTLCLAIGGRTMTGASDPVEHFKYGSVGIESEEGLPYWIWQVLPRLFADKLPGPGGYTSLGIVWEPGHELPIGFSRKSVWGSERVAVNCAFCHTATYRTEAGGPVHVVPGGPSHQAIPQAFARFLEAAAADPRFESGTMLNAINQIGRLSWSESLMYRLVLIPATRKALLRHHDEFAWMDQRPAWGRGRIDPLNPFKYRVLKVPQDQTIGNSDMTALWGLAARDGKAFHWDGLNSSLHEVVLSSAVGNGASRKSIDLESLSQLEDWLRRFTAPAYPLAIDRALAARGEPIFRSRCATCHARDGSRMGQVIPIAEIGTDRHRLDTWTRQSAVAFNDFAQGYPWQFKQFRKTDGYVAMPLDGVWLTGPYLHNGSVPSLTELLLPPAERPRVFYRGGDLFDAERVGFRSDREGAGPLAFRVDTAVAGNGNGGHLYGIDLAADEKRALVEFLKTR